MEGRRDARDFRYRPRAAFEGIAGDGDPAYHGPGEGGPVQYRPVRAARAAGALSRGAARCTFVDQRRDAAALVRENLKLTGLSQQARVVQGDSISFLMSCREKFDVIFLDPPYLTGALEKAVETVSAFDILREHGIMVCESPLEQELPALAAPYERGKEYRYGKIKLTVYRHLGGEDRR